ncbi:MAG: hypothetical protein ABSA46_18665 [Thermodesulfovibrionales bacterium]|jgi:CRISPR/Cas system-associated exonuclease Cas4 (RecB family)
METNILSEVVAVEREIQRCIEIEKEKSREWIEKVKKESQEELLREQEKIHETLRNARDEARKKAESEAAVVVKDALVKVELLDRLKDETLTRIIEKRLIKILPE